MGVWYSVFVRSFADGNKDGIGDLNGLIEKMDYFSELGIEGLWLLPIFPSPSYHKYDVTNYNSIDPEYGTIAEFNLLIQNAHHRGIKIILDMVLNHTSDQHHYFQAAMQSKRNPYRKWYVWKKAKEIPANEISSWHVPKAGPQDEFYYGLFWSGMPDLNYDNLAVRKAAKDIATFWLNLGVDGFRLDAAMHIFPPGKEDANYKWWQEFRSHVSTLNPDAIVVGEIAESCGYIAPYLYKGVTSAFNFELSEHITQAVLNGQHDCLPVWLKGVRDLYKGVEPQSKDSIFLSNHDQERIASRLNGDSRKIKLAAAILLTLPGIPFIYYGEEIGMLGNKPDENIREPFLWKNEKDNDRTRWIKPIFSTDATVDPLDEQREDPSSIYHLYKNLIRIRNTNKILELGEINTVQCEENEVLIFSISYQNNTFLILNNLINESVILKNEDDPKHSFQLIYASHPDCEANEHEFELAPFSSMILSKLS